jgi:hypothetical protein
MLYFKNAKFLSLTMIAAAMCLSSGCASIVNGNHQPVSVDTGNVQNASCELNNSKGTYYVNNTPATVVVNRSFSAISVSCHKDGYHTTVKSVESSTKPMAFGNIIFGGVIGAGIDMADGAAYDYPANISVQMRHV